MGATYSSAVTVGVYLTNSATQNPTTITATGYLSNSSNPYRYALYGAVGFAWTVVNQGTITSVGDHAGGIELSSGGTVINSGTIEGSGNGADGIRLSAGGTVINASGGTISNPTGSSVYILGGLGTVTNAGTLGAVWLQTAGTVTNQAGGTISNNNPNGGYGVGFYDSGIVTNAGEINGLLVGVDMGSFGDTLGGSGTVTNEAGGAISGRYAGVLLGFPGQTATQGGGSLTNQADGTISGDGGVITGGRAATVTNAGSIAGTTAGTFTKKGITLVLGSGVFLDAGGVLTNQTGGIITGVYSGVYSKNVSASVANFGTIEGIGDGAVGVYLDGGSTVTNTGLIEGDDAVKISGQGIGGAVTNSGTILGTGTHGSGIILDQGGSVGNTGLIEGRQGASSNYASGAAAPGIITNSGSILGNAGVGIHLGGGGVLTNQIGGQISGFTGVVSQHIAATVTNAGSIAGTLIGTSQGYTSGDGVFMVSGGMLVNQTGGVITGVAYGVDLGNIGTTSAAATVINSGNITGSVGIWIGAADTGDNTIVNFGTIVGTGGTAISLGTVGNELIVIGSGSSLQGVVTNLQPGDRFDLPFLPFDSSGTATVVSNGTVSQQLQVVENGGTFTIALDANLSFSGDVFQLSTDSGSGTLVTEQAVCFCRGTLILTDRGEVAVENLAVRDRVKTLSGAFKPIVWIGFGRDLVTQANPLARPIIVRRGALADEVPQRDLYLTHGHALYFDGILIPVENLVNHRSILWDESARVVEYYHIELADHEVLFAEGTPAESYYDANNRALFQNTRPGSKAGADKPTCAPVLNSGETVERVWARLFERTGGQIQRETTDDPDLHLVVDGERLDPASVAEGVYTFALVGPPDDTLLLSSRSGVPSLLGLNRHEHRRLGVAIRQIILRRPGVLTCFDHDAPLFREGGCHLAERGHSWTDGELALPAELFAHLMGAFTLIVHTRKQAMRYPIRALLTDAA